MPSQPTLAAGNLPELLRRIYATRHVSDPLECERTLQRLPSPWLLTGMEAAVRCLAEAIHHRRHIVVAADFDADGATGCALAVRGLRLLGAERVSFVVPNRFKHNYGLTPELVETAAALHPEVLVTVDNGVAAIEGVAAARARGWQVLVTDHHLPGDTLPAAEAMVNPNLPGDRFPSRCLAGVGVMFYLLIGLRAALRDGGAWKGGEAPNLGCLLDLVALGTVADVVPLDHVNRILVHQGLLRIRAGQACPGVQALLEVAGRRPAALVAGDLGYAIGPRLNAAGRLDDMSLGIRCLLAEDPAQARALAVQLDGLNLERREIEEQMRQEALGLLSTLDGLDRADQPAGVCLYDEGWHPGVVGILAARIKDRLHRPVIAFAPGEEGEVKGSARSIAGIHIRDVLSEVAAFHPGLLRRYGGHAMAAGLSLCRRDLERFAVAFDETVRRHGAGTDLEPVRWVDGQLEPGDLTLANAELLRDAGPWGQGFPEPTFCNEFEVRKVRIVGERHLKLVLAHPAAGAETIGLDAILFGVDEPAAWLECQRVRAVYSLDVNEFRGERSLQLRVVEMEPL